MRTSGCLAKHPRWRGALVLVLVGTIACGCDSASDAGSAAEVGAGFECEISLAAFFEPEITVAALEIASRSVAQVEGVTRVDVLDHAEARAQVLRIFADDPSTLALIEESGVPPSIWVEVNARPVLDEVEQKLRATPLLRTIRRADGEIAPEIADLIGDEALRRWCGT